MYYYSNCYAMNQYLANRGYVVLSVNYRSGIGYGRAFREAPGRAGRGASEYQDVVAGQAVDADVLREGGDGHQQNDERQNVSNAFHDSSSI
jgi:hypothetical protein